MDNQILALKLELRSNQNVFSNLITDDKVKCHFTNNEKRVLVTALEKLLKDVMKDELLEFLAQKLDFKASAEHILQLLIEHHGKLYPELLKDVIEKNSAADLFKPGSPLYDDTYNAEADTESNLLHMNWELLSRCDEMYDIMYYEGFLKKLGTYIEIEEKTSITNRL